MNETTVLVADAQRLMADVLRRLIALEPGLTALDELPSDGLHVVEVAANKRPDVVLLDYWITGMTGPATTAAILEESPDTKVLLLSWLPGRPQIKEGLNAGATGFLPKGITFAQLAEAIRSAAAGHPIVYGEELAGLDDRMRVRHDAQEEQYNRLRRLGPRELELLRALGRGRSLSQVADELSLSQLTARTYVHRILSKTGARSQMEAVALAHRYRLIQAPSAMSPEGTS